MRSTCLNLCIVVVAASCGFPRLHELPAADGGPVDSEPIDEGGTVDNGPPALELLAGNPDGRGSVDGAGAAARFNFPRSVAVDGVGNVYIADGTNTIRKVTPTGVVTTLAGTAGSAGSADGT